MYLTHPVRRIRETPTEGETITLLLGFDEDAPQAREEARSKIERLGGRLERELPFETLEVTVPETVVADVVELDGLDHVETAEVLILGADGSDREGEPMAEQGDPDE